MVLGTLRNAPLARRCDTLAMSRLPLHPERHTVSRVGWLRAAVLGANDGIVSTGSLIVGIAASSAARPEILLAGIASLVAGAMSMAAGEYVSVSSQADSEKADLARESGELRDQPGFEREELAGIYVARGLTPALAGQVKSGNLRALANTIESRVPSLPEVPTFIEAGDRKSTRLNSSHACLSRMPSSA